MKEILVICIGNICRSPMAEALLKQALPNTTVVSAGIGALIGKPADPFAVQLMVEQNIDIATHRAQQISTSLVNRVDLILTMDIEQKKYVESNYPSSRGKVFRICEATKCDVADPYREGIDSFRASLQLIEEGIKTWASRIEQLR